MALLIFFEPQVALLQVSNTFAFNWFLIVAGDSETRQACLVFAMSLSESQNARYGIAFTSMLSGLTTSFMNPTVNSNCGFNARQL